MELEVFLPYIFGLIIALPFLVLLRRFVHGFLHLKKKELQLLSSKSDNGIEFQAYERMTLFLERIKPSNLVDKFDKSLSIQEYVFLLEKNISEEFEYNVSQQLYIRNETWQNIITTKNDILNLIRTTKEKVSREANLQEFKTLFLMNYLSGRDFVSEMIDDLRIEIKRIT